MVAALKLLESEGFFGTGAERNKIVLFVSISNDDDAVRLAGCGNTSPRSHPKGQFKRC
jgi:hypothetical protein